MKRLTTFLAASAAFALALSGCSTPKEAPESKSGPVEIGAVTIVSHPALDAVYEGFKKGMSDLGYVEGKTVNYEFQNPQGDQGTLISIANTYASSKKDLFLAIATPPAEALAHVITDRPILFAAVSDPQSAGLVKSWEKPGGNITGLSDRSPVKEQLKLLKDIVPTAKTVGIVYTSSETNSEYIVKLAKEVAPELGLSIKTATVVNSSEVAQASVSLDVDAYYVPTDNTVVSAIESMIQVAEQHKRPLITADGDSVKRGAAAALSIDYYKQGVQAAAMADKILKGQKPQDTPVETQARLDTVVNPAAAKRMGVDLPKSVIDRADKVINK